MPGAFKILASRHQSRTRTKKRKRKSISTKNTTSPKTAAAGIKTYANEDEEAEVGFSLKPSSCSQSHIIQPLGNLLLFDPSTNIRNSGLGNLRILSDEVLVDILSLLDGNDLGVLSSVSKSFFVFSNHEPLWRNLILKKLKGDFLFSNSWRSTYILSINPNFSPLSTVLSTLRIRNFYSDYLFQSWLCANMDMKPEWLQRDNIERRRQLPLDEFVTCFEELNKPVLLEGCIDHWPALATWCKVRLVQICGDAKFAVGPVKMTMQKYFRYSETAKEERPLYLFDSDFGEKITELGSDYDVPVYFKEDLFSLLGSQRPDYRWIIIGPAGSGSSFHVDPNSTSAWNAVIRGSKKWVMFPPEVVPPGVHPSQDGSEVACPVSIMEWFMNFYSASRSWKKRPIECVCKAGEVVFVPNGWWHIVVNLEDSIAITQNYVSRRNLLSVLDFLKRPNANELVSGTKDKVNLHDKFRAAIEAAFPGMVDQLSAKAMEKKMAQNKQLNYWESAADANTGGFRFSF